MYSVRRPIVNRGALLIYISGCLGSIYRWACSRCCFQGEELVAEVTTT